MRNSFLKKKGGEGSHHTKLLEKLQSFRDLAISRRRAAPLAWSCDSGSTGFVSANGLRRKTQLSRNQSLISHLVSVRRTRWNYRSFVEHLRPWTYSFFFLRLYFLSAACCAAPRRRAVSVHSCPDDFIRRQNCSLRFRSYEARLLRDIAPWHARVHDHVCPYKRLPIMKIICRDYLADEISAPKTCF